MWELVFFYYKGKKKESERAKEKIAKRLTRSIIKV